MLYKTTVCIVELSRTEAKVLGHCPSTFLELACDIGVPRQRQLSGDFKENCHSYLPLVIATLTAFDACWGRCVTLEAGRQFFASLGSKSSHRLTVAAGQGILGHSPLPILLEHALLDLPRLHSPATHRACPPVSCVSATDDTTSMIHRSRSTRAAAPTHDGASLSSVHRPLVKLSGH